MQPTWWVFLALQQLSFFSTVWSLRRPGIPTKSQHVRIYDKISGRIAKTRSPTRLDQKKKRRCSTNTRSLWLRLIIPHYRNRTKNRARHAAAKRVSQEAKTSLFKRPPPTNKIDLDIRRLLFIQQSRLCFSLPAFRPFSSISYSPCISVETK